MAVLLVDLCSRVGVGWVGDSGGGGFGLNSFFQRYYKNSFIRGLGGSLRDGFEI